jgi:TetR/AcrR family transcriptional regulator
VKKENSVEKSTMDRILDAAIPLFAMKGYAAVSVKELAQAADVNIALISYYFGGKENLYGAVVKTQFMIVADIMNEICGKDHLSPSEKIRCFGRLVSQAHSKCPYISHLIYGEIINPTASFGTIVKKEISELSNFLSACIREAIARGEFRSDLDPEYAALSLSGIINFYFFTQHLSKEILPPRENQMEYYISQAVEIYLQGVLAPGKLQK